MGGVLTILNEIHLNGGVSMFRRVIKKMKRVAFVLAVLVLIFSLSTSFLEASDCELGLALCWFDYMSLPEIAVFYCGIGYIFCKKYIEN